MTSLKQNLQIIEEKIGKGRNDVEKDLLSIAKSLLKENKKLQKQLFLKTEFVNHLSHDLRTPLTPILTILPVISDEISDKELKREIDICIRNGTYIKRLINSTLDLIKVEKGVLEFRISAFNLRKIIEDVIKGSGPLYSMYKINTRIEVPKGIFVKGDELRVREVLENIQDNAIKAMEKGGKLIFKAKKEKNHAKVSIQDTGIGMEKDKLKKIFQEFYKIDSARKNLEGCGLGLTICKKILKRLNGKIWAESKGFNKGSTFYFTLPIQKKS